MVAINDNIQSREYGGTYHDSFALQYPNQYAMDAVLRMFALGLPVYETWPQRFY